VVCPTLPLTRADAKSGRKALGERGKLPQDATCGHSEFSPGRCRAAAVAPGLSQKREARTLRMRACPVKLQASDGRAPTISRGAVSRDGGRASQPAAGG